MSLLYTIFSRIIVNGLVLYALLRIVEDISYTGGLKFFVVGAVILGLLNLVVKPLLKILSFPITALSGGLFLIVINAFILWLLRVSIDIVAFRDVTLVFANLGSYAIGGLVFGICNWVATLTLKH